MVVASGLVAAIIWNLLTWWWGIPSSSSHTLIGGFAGAGIANAGSLQAVHLSTVLPVIYFIVLAPVMGMVLSYIISVITINIYSDQIPPKLTEYSGGCSCCHRQPIVWDMVVMMRKK